MDSFQRALNAIEGGKVLDVATGGGGFVAALAEHLGSFESITGVDTLEPAIEKAGKAFEDDRIAFEVGDAHALPYEDGVFDTVAIANSLHHMERLDDVLAEMLRVLRPGGKLVVFEMYRDGQSDPQLTHVELHHWWAAVDTAGGTHHRETYTRDEVESLLRALPLESLVMDDYEDEDSDPLSEEVVGQVEGAIDVYIQRANATGADNIEELVARGEALRQRLHDVGFRGATHVIAVGTK